MLDRVLEFKFNNVNYVTCEWDFGCDIIFNDYMVCLKQVNGETDKLEKITLDFCKDIICRLLRNVSIKKSELNKISIETITVSFTYFKKWFSEDIDYMTNCMRIANPKGIKTSDSEPLDVANNLLYIAYQMSDAFGTPLSSVYQYQIDDIAHYLMFKEMEAVKRYNEEKGSRSVF